MAVLTDFLIELLASLAGAFAGFSLALFGDRAAQRRRRAEEETKEQALLASARRAVLGSVVKNAGTAKRLKRRLDDPADPFLLGVVMETSVWEASHNEILTLSPSMDEQVGFARFFDEAARIEKLLGFHRDLRARGASEEVLTSTRARLGELADEIRLSGTVLITDFGEDVHRQLLGILDGSQRTP